MKHTRVEVVCDLHDDVDARELHFGIDGVNYQIDVCDEDYKKLLDTLAVYTSAGRRIRGDGTLLPKRQHYGRPHAPVTPVGATTAGYRRVEVPVAYKPAQVRHWWRTCRAENLPQWRANGPLPGIVVDAYKEAHAPS